MKIRVAILLALTVTSCAVPMVPYTGPKLSFRHGTAIDPREYPLEYANAYCAQVGMRAQYIRTFYPNLRRQQQTTPYNPYFPLDAGQIVQNAGHDMQDASDLLDSMPTSHYVCIN